MKEFKLKDAELIKEDGKFYITAKYDVETDADIRVVEIKKVPLPLNDIPVVMEEGAEMLFFDNEPRYALPYDIFADIGYGKIRMPAMHTAQVYTETVVSQKVQELTLEEIEKKLGFKVKVVTKKKVKAIRDKVWCDKCYFAFTRKGGTCNVGHCHECDNSNLEDCYKNKISRCKCNTIAYGEPCPYFKEQETK